MWSGVDLLIFLSQKFEVIFDTYIVLYPKICIKVENHFGCFMHGELW